MFVEMGIDINLVISETAAADWICHKCEKLLEDPVLGKKILGTGVFSRMPSSPHGIFQIQCLPPNSYNKNFKKP